MGTKSAHPVFHKITRHDGVFQEQVHDTYQTKGKLPEPTVCQRILESQPAGFVTLAGDFFVAHRDEIVSLMHDIEKKAEHPLRRIMATEDEGNGILITTTDIHLARGIDEAIHHAYHGELEFHYNPAENLLRVN